MKLLVVDDEQHARDAVKMLVPWKEYGIQQIWEADTGEAAKRVISANPPDIVITDMHMPIADGAALMEWIMQHVPSIKIIVISGYSDFEYVRHTLKHGGMDYLLKPIDPEQLTDAVRNVIRSIEIERKEQQVRSRQSIEMNQFRPVYWDNLFSRLLNDPSMFVSVRKQLVQEFGLPDRGTVCRAVVYNLNPIPPLLLRKFRGDRDLIVFAVTNIINDLIRSQWQAGYAFRHWKRTESIVIIVWNELKLLPLKLQKLSDAINTTLRVTLHFGIGSEGALPESLGRSAEEAYLALSKRNLLQTKPAIHWFDASAAPTGDASVPHLNDIEEEIRLALICGNEAELEKIWLHWMNRVRSMNAVTLEHLGIWRSEFLILRGRWLQSLSGSKLELPESDDLFTAVYDDQGKLSLDQLERNVLQTFVSHLQSIGQHQREDRNITGEIKQYIDHHLHEDVSLQKLAARFYLSREYVSRRFRQETGQTLSEYVERLRVDKAKLLLGNPVLKITEIAEMVGYPDEKYFSKVFKKQTGCSPNQYRKQFSDFG